MVKDHSDSESPHMGYSFRLAASGLSYATSYWQDKDTSTFVTPVVEHWLEREMTL